MIWLTTFGFAVLLLSVQYDGVEGKKASPWTNPQKASQFVSCLTQQIRQSPEFPQQEKKDMENIMKSMLSAIVGMGSKGGNSGATLQAMNMAFASSMAELVIAEDVGNMALITKKTNVLVSALGQCFKSVLGVKNRQFINEIKDLIKVFAEEAAKEANEVEEDTENFESSSTFEVSQQTSVQSTDSSSSSFSGLDSTGGYTGIPSGGYPGGPDYGQGSDNVQRQLVQTLTEALQGTQSMSLVSRAKLFSINSSYRSDFARLVSGPMNLGGSAQSELLVSLAGISPNSDARVCANVIVSACVKAMLSSGVSVSDSNSQQIASQLSSTIVDAVCGAAGRAGMRIPDSVVQSDKNLVSQTISSISSTSSATTTTTTSSSSFSGLDSTGGYTGIPSGGYPGGPDYGQGSDNVQRQLVQTLTEALQGTQSMSLVSRAKLFSINSSYRTDFARLVSGPMNLGGSAQSELLVSLAGISPNSDARVCANVIVSACVKAMLSSGVLVSDSNSQQIASQLSSTIVDAVCGAAGRAGMRIPDSVVQSDKNLVSQTISSISSTSSATTTTTTSSSSFSGLDSTGGYTGIPSGGYPGGPDYGEGSDNVQRQLVQTLTEALQGTQSMSLVSRAKLFSINSSYRTDFARLVSGPMNLGGSAQSELLVSLAGISPNSDARVCANVIVSACVKAMLSSGVSVSDSNSQQIASQLSSTIVDAVCGAAGRAGMRIPDSVVQSDKNLVSQTITSISSTSSATTTTTTSVQSTDSSSSSFSGLDSTGGYTGIPSGGYPGGPDYGQGSDNVQKQLVQTLTEALQGTQSMSLVSRAKLFSINSSYRTDFARLVSGPMNLGGSAQSELLVSLAGISPNSDARVCANVIVSACVKAMLSSGVSVSDSNSQQIASKLSSTIVDAVCGAAGRAGMRIPDSVVQSDKNLVSQTISSISSTSSATTTTTTSSSSFSGLDSTGGYTGIPSGGYPGGPDYGQGSDNVQRQLVQTLTEALQGTQSMSLVSRAKLFSINSSYRTDFARLVSGPMNLGGSAQSELLVSLAGISPNSDARVCANVIVSACVKAMLSSGVSVSDSNSQQIASQLSSTIVDAVCGAAGRAGMRIPDSVVQSDKNLVSQTITSISSTSSATTTTTTSVQSTDSSSSSFSGLDSTGGYTGIPSGGYPGGPDYGQGSDNVQKQLVQTLTEALQGTQSMSLVSRAKLFSINSSYRTDFARLVSGPMNLGGSAQSELLVSLAGISPNSDARVCANVIVSACVKAMLSSGVSVSDSNSQQIASQLSSTIVDAVCGAAGRAGMRIPDSVVQSDKNLVSQTISSISSTSSATTTTTTSSSSFSGLDSTGGYTGIPSGGYPGGPDYGQGSDNVQRQLVQTLTEALQGTQSMSLVSRAKLFSINSSYRTDFARLVSGPMNLGGSAQSELLVSLAGISPNSDARVCANVIVSACVKAMLSSGVSVSDSNSQQIASQLSSTIVDAVCGAAGRAGMRIPDSVVQSDKNLVSQTITSISSTSSATTTTTTSVQSTDSSSSSFSGLDSTGGYTGIPSGGYPGGPDYGQGSDNVQRQLVQTLTEALQGTQSMSLVSRAKLFSINSSYRTDFARLVSGPMNLGGSAQSELLVSLAGISPNSDARVCANVIVSACVKAMLSSGVSVSDSNSQQIASQLSSTIVDAVCGAAGRAGMRIPDSVVQSDKNLVSQTISSISSTSSATTTTTTSSSSFSGLDSTGGYTGIPSGGYPGGPDYGQGSDNVQRQLVQTLTEALQGTQSMSLVSRAKLFSINSSYRTDFARLVSGPMNLGGSAQSELLVSLAGISPNSDARVCANVIVSACVKAMLSSGVSVSDSNSQQIASQLSSTIVDAVCGAAGRAGMRIPDSVVQSDKNLVSQTITSISSTSSATTTTTTSVQSTDSSSSSFSGLDSTGGYTGIPSGGYPGGPDYGQGSDNVQRQLVQTLTEALQGTQSMSLVSRAKLFSINSSYRTDFARLVSGPMNLGGSAQSELLVSLAGISPNSDARVCANVIVSACVKAMLSSGVSVSDSNSQQIASQLSSTIVDAVCGAAGRAGMRIPDSVVQSDKNLVSQTISSISSTSSATTTTTTSSSSFSGLDSTGGYTGIPSGGYPGGPDYGQGSDNVQRQLVQTLTEALQGTQSMSLVSRAKLFSINSSYRTDFARLVSGPMNLGGSAQSELLVSLAGISPNSDARVCANVIVSACVKAMLSSGVSVSDSNSQQIASQLSSTIVDAVCGAAGRAGMRIPDSVVQSDKNLVSQTISSISSTSSATTTTTTSSSSFSGLDSTGGYTGIPSGGYPGGPDYGQGSDNVQRQLVQTLTEALQGTQSMSLVSRAKLFSINSSYRTDFARLVSGPMNLGGSAQSELLVSLAGISPNSDARVCANVIVSACVKAMLSSGVSVSDSNSQQIASQLSSTIVDAVCGAAGRAGMRIPDSVVQSDKNLVSQTISSISSTSSATTTTTTSSSSFSGLDSTGGYTGIPSGGYPGGPDYGQGSDNVQRQLVQTLTEALQGTQSMSLVSRAKLFSINSSYRTDFARLVSGPMNLGGSAQSELLVSLAGISPNSDARVCANVIVSACVKAMLSSGVSVSDSNSQQIASQLSSTIVDAVCGAAGRAGMRIPDSVVQSDKNLVSQTISSISSTSSATTTTTTSSSSFSGLDSTGGYTGIPSGGYPGGPDYGQGSDNVQRQLVQTLTEALQGTQSMSLVSRAKLFSINSSYRTDFARLVSGPMNLGGSAQSELLVSLAGISPNSDARVCANVIVSACVKAMLSSGVSVSDSNSQQIASQLSSTIVDAVCGAAGRAGMRIPDSVVQSDKNLVSQTISSISSTSSATTTTTTSSSSFSGLDSTGGYTGIPSGGYPGGPDYGQGSDNVQRQLVQTLTEALQGTQSMSLVSRAKLFSINSSYRTDFARLVSGPMNLGGSAQSELLVSLAGISPNSDARVCANVIVSACVKAMLSSGVSVSDSNSQQIASQLSSTIVDAVCGAAGRAGMRIPDSVVQSDKNLVSQTISSISSTSSATTTTTTSSSSFSGLDSTGGYTGIPSGGYPGGPDYGQGSDNVQRQLVQTLTEALQGTQSMSLVSRAKLFSINSSYRTDFARLVSGPMNLGGSAQSELLVSLAGISPNSDARVCANVIVSACVKAMLSSGVLVSDSNSQQIASQLSSTIVDAVCGAAGRAGMRIPDSVVQSDKNLVSQTISSISSTSSATTTTTTSSSSFSGLDSTGGYTGIPSGGYPGGPDYGQGSDNVQRQLVQTLTEALQGTQSMSLVSRAKLFSINSSYRTDFARLVSGPMNLGGSAQSELLVSLAGISPNSDARVCANVIVSACVKAMLSSGVSVSDSNSQQIASQLSSTIVDAVCGAAGRAGMRIPDSVVQSDKNLVSQTISSISSTSSATTTTTTSSSSFSGLDSTGGYTGIPSGGYPGGPDYGQGSDNVQRQLVQTLTEALQGTQSMSLVSRAKLFSINSSYRTDFARLVSGPMNLGGSAQSELLVSLAGISPNSDARVCANVIVSACVKAMLSSGVSVSDSNSQQIASQLSSTIVDAVCGAAGRAGMRIPDSVVQSDKNLVSQTITSISSTSSATTTTTTSVQSTDSSSSSFSGLDSTGGYTGIPSGGYPGGPDYGQGSDNVQKQLVQTLTEALQATQSMSLVSRAKLFSINSSYRTDFARLVSGPMNLGGSAQSELLVSLAGISPNSDARVCANVIVSACVKAMLSSGVSVSDSNSQQIASQLSSTIVDAVCGAAGRAGMRIPDSVVQSDKNLVSQTISSISSTSSATTTTTTSSSSFSGLDSTGGYTGIPSGGYPGGPDYGQGSDNVQRQLVQTLTEALQGTQSMSLVSRAKLFSINSSYRTDFARLVSGPMNLGGSAQSELLVSLAGISPNSDARVCANVIVSACVKAMLSSGVSVSDSNSQQIASQLSSTIVDAVCGAAGRAGMRIPDSVVQSDKNLVSQTITSISSTSSATTTTTTSVQSTDSSSSSFSGLDSTGGYTGIPSGGYPGGPDYGQGSDNVQKQLVQTLTEALQGTQSMSLVSRAKLFSINSSYRTDFARLVSGPMNLGGSAQSELLVSLAGISPNSDARVCANVIVSACVKAMLSSGVLVSDSNSQQIASQLSSTIVDAVCGAAGRAGMRIPDSVVQSDKNLVSQTISSISSTSSATTRTTTSSSSFSGLDSTGGYTGIPSGGYPGGPDYGQGSDNVQRQLVQTLTEALQGTQSMSLVSRAKLFSINSSYRTDFARLVSGPMNLGGSAQSELLVSLAGISPNSDARVCANVIVSACVKAMLSSGVSVSDSNSQQIASQLSSTIVDAVCGAAGRAGMRIPDSVVQSDKNLVSQTITSISSTSSATTTTTTSVQSTDSSSSSFSGLDSTGGYTGIPSGGYPGGPDYGQGSDNVQKQLVQTLTEALQGTQSMSLVSRAKLFSINSSYRTDFARLVSGPMNLGGSAQSELLVSLAGISPNSDARVCANVIVSACVKAMLSSGVSVSDSNSQQIASQLSSTIVDAVCGAAGRAGMRIPDSVVQSDKNLVSQTISSISSTSSATTTTTTSSSSFSGLDSTGGYTGIPSGGYPGGPDYGQGSDNVQRQLVQTLTEALQGTQSMSLVSRAKLFSINSSYRSDFARLVSGPMNLGGSAQSELLVSLAGISPNSDARVCANVIVSACVKAMLSSGVSVSDSNSQQIASQLSSTIVDAVCGAAGRAGMRIPDSVVQSDKNLVSQTISSISSTSSATTTTTTSSSSFSGLDSTGGYTGIPSGGYPGGPDYGQGSDNVQRQLVQTLTEALQGTQSMSLVSRAKLFSINSSYRTDFARLVSGPMNLGGSAQSELLVSLAGISPNSDARVCANVIVSACVKAMLSSGVSVSDSNSQQIASQLSSTIVDAVCGAAGRAGMRIPDSVVQSDKNLVSQTISSISSTSSATTTTTTSVQSTDSSSSSFSGLDSTGGYTGIPSGGYPGGPDYGQGSGNVQRQLVQTITEALQGTQTMKLVFGAQLFPNNSFRTEFARLVSGSMNLGGSASSELLVSLAGISPTSDARVSFKVLVSACVGAMLSSGVSVSDSNCQQIASQLSSTIVDAVCGAAVRAGVRIPDSVVQSDKNLVSQTISSTSSATTTSATSVQSTDLSSSSFLGQDSTGVSSSTSVSSIINSPNGLKSPQANARINSLASLFNNAIGSNGVQIDAVSQGLAGIMSNLKRSGMSPTQAQVEALVEMNCALLKIVVASQGGSPNSVSSSSMTSLLSVML
ncbi:aciniform spidroin 1A variant 1 [Caerostris darwini]|uniref:Aciniform spidroin 1A variant 1 n=1 Tax=Caerostris darwini TaxID=1538125 RepID=A0AAV4X6I8_9ARAC|nr:aciniform spidroin 1A variant 1 [Caerostris darwini]